MSDDPSLRAFIQEVTPIHMAAHRVRAQAKHVVRHWWGHRKKVTAGGLIQFGLLIVGVVYCSLTYRLFDITQKQFESNQRPWVNLENATIASFQTSHEGGFNLNVDVTWKNIGASVATNAQSAVTLSLDPMLAANANAVIHATCGEAGRNIPSFDLRRPMFPSQPFPGGRFGVNASREDVDKFIAALQPADSARGHRVVAPLVAVCVDYQSVASGDKHYHTGFILTVEPSPGGPTPFGNLIDLNALPAALVMRTWPLGSYAD